MLSGLRSALAKLAVTEALGTGFARALAAAAPSPANSFGLPHVAHMGSQTCEPATVRNPTSRLLASPIQRTAFVSTLPCKCIHTSSRNASEGSPSGSVEEALDKLIEEARRCMNAGQFEIAERLLVDGSTALAMDVGKESLPYIHVRIVLITMLSLVGDFSRCIEVCEELRPIIAKVDVGSDALAYTCLRLAAAYIAEGDMDAAVQALEEPVRYCMEFREEHDRDSPMLGESMFYLNLLQLYEADSVQDVKAVENSLLVSISALHAATGHDSTNVTSALQAHSKLLFRRIEQEQHEIADALFEQLTHLHRATQCSDAEMALLLYQRGTWLYTLGDHVRAMEFIQDSINTLKAAAESTELDDAESGDKDDSSEHQMTLNKQRLAVIDAVMLAEGEAMDGRGRSRDEILQSAHEVLSHVKAFYEDLLGPDNPLTAEAKVALGMLGIASGLASDPGKKKTLTHNITSQLKVMAKSLPGGAEHSLIQKLQRVCEKHLGPLDLTAQESEHHTHDHSCSHTHHH